MRTLNKICCTLCCVLFSIALYAQDNRQITGEWEYSAPEAPYGYTAGVFKINADQDKLNGEMIIGGTTTKINEIRKTGEDYSCTIYVDGYPVAIVIKKKGEGIEGTANADGQLIPITFKRKK